MIRRTRTLKSKKKVFSRKVVETPRVYSIPIGDSNNVQLFIDKQKENR